MELELLPIIGILSRMQNGEYRNNIAIDREKDSERKSPAEGSSNLRAQYLILKWALLNPVICRRDLTQEVVSKAFSPTLIVEARVQQIFRDSRLCEEFV